MRGGVNQIFSKRWRRPSLRMTTEFYRTSNFKELQVVYVRLQKTKFV